MLRNVLAGIAAGVTVGMFVLIVYQTRPVAANERYDHDAVMSMVRQGVDASAAWQASVAAARRDGVAIDSGGLQILDRLAALKSRLDAVQGDSKGEVAHALEAVRNTLGTQLQDSRQLAEHHNAFANAIDYLRRDSPGVVQRLRESGVSLISQDAFEMVVATLDYAADETVESAAITEPLGRLTQFHEASPALGLADLITAVNTVLAERDTAAGIAESVTIASLPLNASSALDVLDRARLADTGRSRNAWALLSVFGALLLAGLSFLAWRYWQIFSALDAANATLAAGAVAAAEPVSPDPEPHIATPVVQESADAPIPAQSNEPESLASRDRLIGRFSQEISTHLWYLLNNATLVDERLDQVADFVSKADSTLALFTGPNTDKDRVVAGLKALRKKLDNDRMSEELTVSRSLIKDSVEGLQELASLMQRFGEYTCLEAIEVEGFDMNEALDKVLQELQENSKEHIPVRRDYRALPPITCNRSQIDQALYALLAKAAGSANSDREMWIRTQEQGGNIKVTVADSYRDAREGQLPGVAEPSVSIEDSGEHVDLGLFIADEIIHAHGGELMVGVDREPGSSFTMLLPVDAPHVVNDETGHTARATH